MAARDFGHIAAVLAGPDMDLRRAALRAVRTLPVPDESAEAVLEDAPSALRRAFYRTLLHSGRRALADRLLPQVRERWGDREAAALLPACSGPVVAEALHGLAHAVGAWRTLGRRHPHQVLDAAEADLGDAPVRWRWWGRHGAGIEAAAPHVPERVLSLLERTRDIPGVARLSATFGVLMKTDPARTGPLLLETSWRRFPGLRPSVRAYLRSCSLDEVVARVPVGSYAVHSYLEALPPGRREAVFNAVVERDQHIGDGFQAMPILQLLPQERVAAEARRMLDWHSSTWHSSRARLDDPQIPLKLQAFLPYEEAAGPLREAAFFGDARRRSLARSLWVECASRTGDRAVLAEVVSELALRSVNEQDPVRASLLGTLAGLRPALLDDGLAEPFARLAISAIELRDSSPGTRRILRLLAARVLRHAEAPALVEWAMDVYVRLVARYGAAGLAPAEMAPESPRHRARGRRVPVADDHRLDRVLRQGQEDDLLDRLRPHMETARRRGDFSLALGLARSLGRRAYGLPELQDDLRAAVVQGSESQSREAADLWLAERSTREDRAVGLFRADPAMIVHPRVWAVIAGRRTDLLATVPQGGAPPDWAPRSPRGGPGDGPLTSVNMGAACSRGGRWTRRCRSRPGWPPPPGREPPGRRTPGARTGRVRGPGGRTREGWHAILDRLRGSATSTSPLEPGRSSASPEGDRVLHKDSGWAMSRLRGVNPRVR